jgi:hypothetical protein
LSDDRDHRPCDTDTQKDCSRQQMSETHRNPFQETESSPKRRSVPHMGRYLTYPGTYFVISS